MYFVRSGGDVDDEGSNWNVLDSYGNYLSADYWWLRSPRIDYTSDAYQVDSGGVVHIGYVLGYSYGIMLSARQRYLLRCVASEVGW